jgi:predicted  nucleic acid-binding Zn-ribbon protein
MPRITISYRREDSGVITGRIFDRLTNHYGRDSVFRDIDSIPPGADFREFINVILDESDIVLAVVGPRWLGARAGQTRLSDEADLVRVEIETALRKGMPLIPVMVQRATMPRVALLPDTLRDFAYKNGVQVDSGQDFDVHIARLIRAMDRILRQRARDAPSEIDSGGADIAAGSLPARIAGPAAGEEPDGIFILPPEPAPDAATEPPGSTASEISDAVMSDAEPADVASLPAADVVTTPQVRPARNLSYYVAFSILGAFLGIATTFGVNAYLISEQPISSPTSNGDDLAAAKRTTDTRINALQNELAAAVQQSEQDRKQLKADVAAAQDKAAAAQKQLEEQGSQLRDAQNRADNAEKQLAAANAGNSSAAAAVKEATDAKAKLDSQLAALTQQTDQDQKCLSADLTAAQDKAAAAQKQLDEQGSQLRDAQSRADKAEKQLAAVNAGNSGTAVTIKEATDAKVKLEAQLAALKQQAEQDQKRLSADVATAQDKAAAAQKQLGDLGTQLSDAAARAERAEKNLAAQKDASTKAAAQITPLIGQVKSLGDQLTAETDAHRKAVAEVERLTAELKAPHEQPVAAQAQPPNNAPASPEGEANLTAEQRREIQNDLRYLGHLRADADGNFGPATRAAIKQFQSFEGNPETGILSEDERQTLRDMAQRLSALLERPAVSPKGVAAGAVNGAAQRYARAYAFETGKGSAADPAETVYWYGLAATDGEAKDLDQSRHPRGARPGNRKARSGRRSAAVVGGINPRRGNGDVQSRRHVGARHRRHRGYRQGAGVVPACRGPQLPRREGGFDPAGGIIHAVRTCGDQAIPPDREVRALRWSTRPLDNRSAVHRSDERSILVGARPRCGPFPIGARGCST